MSLPLLSPDAARETLEDLLPAARVALASARAGLSDILLGAALLLLLLAAALGAGGALVLATTDRWWTALGLLPSLGLGLLGARLWREARRQAVRVDALPPPSVALGRLLLERGRDLPDLPGTGTLALVRGQDGTAWAIEGSRHARLEDAAAVAADPRAWGEILDVLSKRRPPPIALVRIENAVVALSGNDRIPLAVRIPSPSLLR